MAKTMPLAIASVFSWAKGVYLGTESPDINIARIERRVLKRTGHRVDPARVPECYRWSLTNLRRTVERFDLLEVFDNSCDDPIGIPQPVEQCYLERGELRSRCPRGEMVAWCADWLVRTEQTLAEQRLRSREV